MKIRSIHLLLLLIVVFGFFLRLPFFFEPMDSDEGNYAFFSFFSKGPNFYSMLPIGRLPGIIFTYRFLDSLFPGNIVAFRVFPAILLVFATFAIYKIGSLLFEEKSGIISAFIFALTVSSRVLEPRANTEVFMTPFMIFSVYFFWSWIKRKTRLYLMLAGLSAGISLLYKQVVVFEVAFLVLWLMIKFFDDRRALREKIALTVANLLSFGLSLLAPFLIVVVYFVARNESKDFWWQSFGSGGSYVFLAWSGKEWVSRLRGTSLYLWQELWPFWLSGFGGLALVFKKINKEKLFLLFWVVVSLIGAFFNGWFFSHYFVQIIPPLALMAGFFWSSLPEVVNFRPSWKKLVPFFLIIIFSPIILRQVNYLINLVKWQKGMISKVEYLEVLGVDTKDASWLPFYQAADYLNTNLKKDETIFSWSTSPLIYYLTRQYPATPFIKNCFLLDYSFMLATQTSWKYDFDGNREALMTALVADPPDYVFFEINPSQIFDQLILFKEFGRFIDANYSFVAKFGNAMIYKVNPYHKIEHGTSEVPIEFIKRYGAITLIERKEGRCRVVYEPLINKDGILRILGQDYPSCPDFDFQPLSLEKFDIVESDYVGNSFPEPSGYRDVHIKLAGPSKEVDFVRIKSGEQVWTNQQYGVNHAVSISRKNNLFDIYMEPPPNWKEREYEIYFIHEDGTLSKTDCLP